MGQRKLPDMPDLIHDSLKQLRTLPEIQHRQFEQQVALQRRQHKASLATVVGATFLVLAALIPLHSQQWWPSLVPCRLGVAMLDLCVSAQPSRVMSGINLARCIESLPTNDDNLLI